MLLTGGYRKVVRARPQRCKLAASLPVLLSGEAVSRSATFFSFRLDLASSLSSERISEAIVGRGTTSWPNACKMSRGNAFPTVKHDLSSSNLLLVNSIW